MCRFKCGGEGCGRFRKSQEGILKMENTLRAKGENLILQTSKNENLSEFTF